MSRTCHVALIGQKFMGRAHSNAFRQAPCFFDLPIVPVLHAIAARDSIELAAFAERWGYTHQTTRWQDIAEDGDVDLVDVATPNDLHAEPSIAMLEAGKHVACEKPLARTLDEARTMRDAAKKSRRRTFVWFNYRRCPAVAFAYRLVRDGRLGDIRHVRATYLQSWGGPDTPLLWRFKKKHAGSGAHGDLNAHIIDMARFLTGDEITEVHGAVSRTFVKERSIPGPVKRGAKKTGRSDVDDALLFLASFRGGAVASFEATRVAPGHLNANTMELNGTKGSLRFDFEDMDVLQFHDATVPEAEQGWKRIICTSAGNHPYADAWWPDAHGLGYEHGFTNMVADMMRVLGGEEPVVPLPDFADAYETQRVLEAAVISARERTAIRMREIK